MKSSTPSTITRRPSAIPNNIPTTNEDFSMHARIRGWHWHLRDLPNLNNWKNFWHTESSLAAQTKLRTEGTPSRQTRGLKTETKQAKITGEHSAECHSAGYRSFTQKTNDTQLHGPPNQSLQAKCSAVEVLCFIDVFGFWNYLYSMRE